MRRTPCLFLAFGLLGCSPSAPVPAPVVPEPSRPLEPDQRVENPAYTRWAKAAPGTVVEYEDVTDSAGVVTRGTSSFRLVERTEAEAVVETQGAGEPQSLKQLRWMGKPKGPADQDVGRPVGTYAAGTETVAVRGKDYATKWYKYKGHVEAGETDTQTWYSDAVPGGLVKSVHRIAAIKKTVTTELVAVKLPK